ncbi:MAG TPA: GAF domain-containing protein, partial [Anaerolineae bacterium]|nr:GAF domain-containing protein [Anaerolineae bacterium]HIQ05924.1 GAF domain-containing protein [Anaerolineae bacterium]
MTHSDTDSYDDLTELNRCRDLLDTVGKELLARITSDYLDLLQTSAAIYEVNGDYASALFTSDYCRFLNNASRQLCRNCSDREALDSGLWHCHESCWTEASRITVETGQPFDLYPCRGGINIYAVPIVVERRVVGSINFGYGNPPTDEERLREIADRYRVDLQELRRAAEAYQPRPDYLIQAAKRHLHTTADLIAEMYLRRKVSQSLQQRTAEQELMQRIHEALSRRATLDEVLQLVVESAKPLFAAHAATVYFLSDDRRHLLMRNWALPDDLTRRIEKLTGLDVRHIPLPLVEGGHYWRTVHERQALLISDPQEIEGLIAELAAEHPLLKKLVPTIARLLGYRTILTAPLVTGGEVVGIMDVGSHELLGEQHLHRFQLLANQVALVLERAQAEEQGRKQAARLALVNEISQRASTILDLERLLQEAVEATQRAFGYYDVLIALVDHESNELVRMARAGAYERKAPPGARKPIDPEKGIIDWVALHGETLLANDVTQEPRYVCSFSETRSELCVPIKRGDRVLGVLNVECTRLAAFDQSDVMAMETLAGRLAAAIENARLYNQMQASRDYFEAILRSLHDKVLVIDRDYRITDVNMAFLHQSGYTREEVVGRHCYEVTHQRREPCNGARHSCPAREVWESGYPSRATHVHYDRQGNQVYIDVAASPLRDADGKVIGVIEVYRDVTAEHRLEEKLAAIHKLGRELVLAADEEHIAQAVVDAAEQVLKFRVCGLWLVDEAQRALVRRACTAVGRTLGMSRLPLDGEQGITVAVAHSGEPIYLPDVRLDPRYVAHDGLRYTRSELCVPLKVGERVIGVLNAESDELDAFSDADMQLLSTLAEQAALAFENARLYWEAQRRAERLAVVNRIAQAVSATLRLDDLVETVYQEITRVFHADAFSLALYDQEANELDYRLRVDQGVREPPERRPMGIGLTASIVTRKKPVLVRDFEKEKDRLPPVKLWGTMKAPPSWLGVPMLIGERVVGVISVQAYHPKAYNEEHLDLLSTIAAQVAIAVQNAHLMEETRARAETLAALHEIDQAISASLDPETVCARIVEHAAHLLTCDVANVYLWNEEDQSLTGMASFGAPDRSVKGQRFTLADSRIVPELLATHRPVVIADAVEDPRMLPAWQERFDIRALMGLPLLFGERVVGFLFLVDQRGPRRWRDDEVALAQAFASQAAIAIENARLFEAETRRAEQLAALNAVTAAVSRSLDLDEILNKAADEVIAVIGLDDVDITSGG